MGWDTQVIVIGEKIESKESSINIGEQIFNQDSKRYGKESFYLEKTEKDYIVYYSYDRRKYVPYWVIQEISKKYPRVSFTILGSMLDFLCGPGGIIKIEKGEIIDSYGIWNSIRQQILDSPIKNRKIIYCFLPHQAHSAHSRKRKAFRKGGH